MRFYELNDTIPKNTTPTISKLDQSLPVPAATKHRLLNRNQATKQIARLSSTPIPGPIKRERVIRNLTKQFTRAANAPTVTRDDIRAAADRWITDQKRANREYEKQQRYAETRARVRSRRARMSEDPTEDATGDL